MLTRNIMAAVLATALAAPLSAPLHAQTVSEGAAQLAQSLGVEPGMYSLEQLSRLEGLENDSGASVEQNRQFILDNPMGPLAMEDTMTRAGISQGERELAQSLGVEPGVYSLEQLSRLEGLENDDSTTATQTRDVILNNPEGPLAVSVEFDANTITAGERQLAELVGVEPGMYSLAQLTRLNRLKDEQTPTAQQTVEYILANPMGPLAGG